MLQWPGSARGGGRWDRRAGGKDGAAAARADDPDRLLWGGGPDSDDDGAGAVRFRKRSVLAAALAQASSGFPLNLTENGRRSTEN